jgi:hypothetical protein
VVAITGMGNFAIPNFSLSFRGAHPSLRVHFSGGIAGSTDRDGHLHLGLLVCSMKSFASRT